MNTAAPTVAPLAPYLSAPQFSLSEAVKHALLLADLNTLTEYHREHSVAYARVLARFASGRSATRVEEVPWLPVALFKSHLLSSVADSQRTTLLTSSGTTGQQVSRITVDGETADRQARGLAGSIQHVLGAKRLPMILIDTKSLLKDRLQMSARGAGVLGMMRFGRDHLFALNDDMRLDVTGLREFLAKHAATPVALFGFTYMVWKYFYQELARLGDIDLSRGTLIHSGGWKKLADEAVDNATFKRSLGNVCGLRRIYNFYGMVEQIGSIFLEGDDGLLYPPNFSEVVIRNPRTWEPAAVGEVGVVHVLSTLPLSYPGHSVLTEDLGALEHIDRPQGAGRLGRAFRIVGRAPKTELRGCSDVHAFGNSRAA